ncbi:hypothetical protein FRX31_024985, partial [Thalictrum thalictroides]
MWNKEYVIDNQDVGDTTLVQTEQRIVENVIDSFNGTFSDCVENTDTPQEVEEIRVLNTSYRVEETPENEQQLITNYVVQRDSRDVHEIQQEVVIKEAKVALNLMQRQQERWADAKDDDEEQDHIYDEEQDHEHDDYEEWQMQTKHGTFPFNSKLQPSPRVTWSKGAK